VELGSKRQRTVAGVDGNVLANFESLAWHDNVLIGIRTDGAEMTVVRARLNSAGTSVTTVEPIGTAATAAATLAGDTYYYVAPDSDGGAVVVRAIAVK
jgi:hypothetical protein